MEEFEVTSEIDETTIKVMSYGPQHAIDLARDQGLVGMLHARRSGATEKHAYIPGACDVGNEPGHYEVWRGIHLVSFVRSSPIMAAIWRSGAA